MDSNKNLPDRIKTALESAGLSQGELAEKIQLSDAAVSQWLSGKKEPSGKALRDAAAVLKVDPAWLEYGTGDQPPLNLDKERKRYQESTAWVFRKPPEDGGRDYGNANLWSIPWDIETLVKEAVQNSIDAAVDPSADVEVVFNLIKISGVELDNFLSVMRWEGILNGGNLKGHITQSTENPQKISTILRGGLESLERTKELILLRIDDKHTLGLTGGEYGTGNFPALCRNNLDSQKQNATAGGAFGLGKAVFWRASKFSTVLFCSNLSEPYIDEDSCLYQNLRIIGKADLAWHKLNGDEYAGPGWFGVVEKSRDEKPIKAKSVWNNRALAHDLYLDRDENEGTSIMVVGFQDAASEAERPIDEIAREFEQAVSKIFWPALFSGRLKATVSVFHARNKQIDIIVDPSRYHAHFVDAVSKYRRGEISEKLTEEGDIVVKQIPLYIPKRNRDPKHGPISDDALLILRRASDESQSGEQNQAAYYRGQEMVIMYQSFNNIVSGGIPFQAVVLCGRASGLSETDTAAEQFLRSAEPPAHDRWVLTPELKIDYAPGSKTNLELFFRSIREQIRELIKPTYDNLDDGPRALKELLRIQTLKNGGRTPTDAPRILIDQRNTALLDNYKWQVSVRVKLPDDRKWKVTPALIFASESGGGRRVSWDIQPISGCTSDGDAVFNLQGAREMQFIGVSDPASHPVSAVDSAVKVVLQHVQVMGW